MNFNQYVEGNALKVLDTKIDIRELVSFLQSNTHITELNLAWNNIGKKEAEALANGNLTHLTKLNLVYNEIGKKGVEALAKGNLTHLTELYLTWNNIGDEGAEALANGNLTRLVRLDLWPNKIGEKGVEALANGNLVRLAKLNLCNENAEQYILTSLKRRRNREMEKSASRPSSSGSDRSDLIIWLNEQRNMVEVYLKQDNYSKALETFQEAYEKIRDVLGPNHPDTLYTKALLNLLEERCNREMKESAPRLSSSDSDSDDPSNKLSEVRSASHSRLHRIQGDWWSH